MRLRNTNNAVELEGVNSTSGFNIQANGKAFDILSKGLYTDSIMAVIRELSCNAYDSMVQSGNADTPFTVHLPSKLEPFFSVKDKGLGLSPEDVLGLYSTYFASTKTEDNNTTGAFGLGSKSPFSYSKAFDVIAHWEGQVRTYSVFMDDEGIPTMAELACVPSDEENGIEVKIAVRQDDYEEFRTKAATALRYFATLPTVVGYSGFEFNKHSDTATITDKFIVDRSGSGLTAVQGNVAYKVSRSQIEMKLDRACENFLSRHAVTLFFDIGDLDIAANREEVRYDDETVQNIADTAEAAFQNYLEALNEEINKMDTTGSRYGVYKMLADKFTNSHSLKQIAGTFEFDSEMVNEWMKDGGTIDYTIDWKYHKIVPYAGGEIRVVKGKHNSTGYGTSLEYNVTPGNKIKILRQDVTKGGSMRMNTLVSKGWGSATILAIVPVTDRALAKDDVTATKRQRTTEFNKIKKMLGSPEIKNLSDLTEDIKAERKVRQAGNTFRQFEDDRWVRNKRSKPIFLEKPEPVEGGLYIEIDFLRNFVVNEEKISWTHNTFMDRLDKMLNIINYVNKTNIKTSEVFGLTKKVIKSVGDNVKWISLLDVYKESFAQVLDVAEFHKRISNSPLGLEYCINKSHFAKMVNALPADSNFKELLEPIIETSKVVKDLTGSIRHPVDRHGFHELAQLNKTFGLGITVDTTAFFDKADFSEYTMLSHIDLDYGHYMDDAQAYIEMVEQAVDFV